jgi:hypothetical protein
MAISQKTVNLRRNMIDNQTDRTKLVAYGYLYIWIHLTIERTNKQLIFAQLTSRALLCGLLFLGQIPAWLHVSGCGEAANHSLASLGATSCGCCDLVGSVSDSESATESAIISESSPRRSHNCSDCVICRSLVSNKAHETSTFRFLEFQSLRDVICPIPDFTYFNALVSFTQPRAPPCVQLGLA